MKESIKRLLDDYTITNSQLGYWKAKLEQEKDKDVLENERKYYEKSNETRQEIEALLDTPITNAVDFKLILKEILESIETLEKLLQSDSENLRRHNRDSEALFLLEHYRELLKHMKDKYIKKMIE